MNVLTLTYFKVFEHLNIDVKRERLHQYVEESSLWRNSVDYFTFATDCTNWNLAYMFVQICNLRELPYNLPILVKHKYESKFYVLTRQTTLEWYLYNPVQDNTVTTTEAVIHQSCYEWAMMIEKTQLSKFYSRNKAKEYILGAFKHKQSVYVEWLLLSSCLGSSFLLVYLLKDPQIAVCVLLSTLVAYLCCEIIDAEFSSDGNMPIQRACRRFAGQVACSSTRDKQVDSIYGTKVSTWGLFVYLFMTLAVLYSSVVSNDIEGVANIWWLIHIVYTVVGVSVICVLTLIQFVKEQVVCLLCFGVGLLGMLHILYINVSSHQFLTLDLQGLLLITLLALGFTYFIELFFINKASARSSMRMAAAILSNRKVFAKLVSHDRRSNLSDLPKLNGVYINFKSNAERLLQIVIIPNCYLCANFLTALIEVTRLTEMYALSVQIYYNGESTNESADSYNISRTQTIQKYSSQFAEQQLCVLQNGECVHSQLYSEHNQPPILVKNIFVDKSDYDRFPAILIDDHLVPMMYSPDQLKEHLMLLRY